MLETCLQIAEGAAAKGRLNENLRIVRSNAESDALTKQCWFCGETEADTKIPVEVPLHGDVETTPNYLTGGTRTTWRHATIKVPRCPACKNADAKKEVGAVVGFLIVIAGVILGSVTGSKTTEEAGFVVAGLGLVTAIITGMWVHSKMPKVQGLKRKKDEYPTVKELRGKGWKDGTAPTTN